MTPEEALNSVRRNGPRKTKTGGGLADRILGKGNSATPSRPKHDPQPDIPPEEPIFKGGQVKGIRAVREANRHADFRQRNIGSTLSKFQLGQAARALQLQNEQLEHNKEPGWRIKVADNERRIATLITEYENRGQGEDFGRDPDETPGLFRTILEIADGGRSTSRKSQKTRKPKRAATDDPPTKKPRPWNRHSEGAGNGGDNRAAQDETWFRGVKGRFDSADIVTPDPDISKFSPFIEPNNKGGWRKIFRAGE